MEISGESESFDDALLAQWAAHIGRGGGRISIRDLLQGKSPPREKQRAATSLLFAADDILDDIVESKEDVLTRIRTVRDAFEKARQAAIANTKLYLSMVNDLDIYVATSMRDRNNFREVARTCESVFADPRLKELQLRYFDPTLSASAGHEDKGLIECLMVKCSKVLLYIAGKSDSYGKAAEAAMALSMGKHVVFFCDEENRERFYRDIHPLTRLIDFHSGVAIGGIVTRTIEQTREILHRLFTNSMQYKLEPHPHRSGYLRLVEQLTTSVVRLQTNDLLLSETFWNHYHNRSERSEECSQ